MQVLRLRLRMTARWKEARGHRRCPRWTGSEVVPVLNSEKQMRALRLRPQDDSALEECGFALSGVQRSGYPREGETLRISRAMTMR